jgi:pyridoxamine 5'-phosphate oxidase
MDLANLRREYELHGLLESELSPDPLSQFARWLSQAVEAGLNEPTAMTLATVAPDGQPRARIVLLKGLDQRGLTFFTSYGSHKGQELAQNPKAALLFFWPELERQVRIEGSIERLPAAESEAYFQSRPRESRLAAWASPQSQTLASREALEARLREVTKRFGSEGEVPRPTDWGGYLLAPRRFEFWQGRPARLHDRLVYQPASNGAWSIERLGP